MVGVPGDRLRLENKRLYLNRHPVNEPYVVHVTPYLDSYRDNFPCRRKVMLPPHAAEMLQQHVVHGELVVPPGMYFAMGDNRDNSSDSRYWGFGRRENRENIIGKPILIFWSYDAPPAGPAPTTRLRAHRRRGPPFLLQNEVGADIPHPQGLSSQIDMSANHYYGLILAGGRGTRFWPRSRRNNAKQVLDFLGGGTLIQQTVERLRPVLPPERIWVLTNDHLRDRIIKQLPDVPKRQILSEPAQRNTAPAIGLAAHILNSIDPEAVMGVFPADHYISKPKRYLRLLRASLKAASQGKMAVLGIQPRWPETGYGYIEFPAGVEPGSLDPSPVLSFREKPDRTTAEKFVEDGCFCWNAGMFFWRASVFLEALRHHLPRTASILAALPAFSSRKFQSALAEAFPHCENISVDFAVLEKATGVVGIVSDDFGWNDVGSWDAVHELMARDADGNASRTPTVLLESGGNYVDAAGKVVALLGVRDLIVVDTPDALLIADRARAQQVGDIVKLLEKQKRHQLL